MASPFPGMAPFIESQRWLGFHTQLVPAIGQALVPLLRPKYEVDFQDYVYLAAEGDDEEQRIAPDAWVAEAAVAARGSVTAPGGSAVAVATPTVLTMPAPKRLRQPYLLIRTKEGRELVTVIELLSPWNKTPVEGRAEYLGKRQNILKTGAHLAEIDLLRGGERLPTREPLPSGDYFVYVCRREARRKVEVYSWPLREPCPGIAIPLSAGDADVPLDLQRVVRETYDRAGYDYVLDYDADLHPPPHEPDARWVAARIEEWRGRGG